jgi:hypothetical protein
MQHDNQPKKNLAALLTGSTTLSSVPSPSFSTSLGVAVVPAAAAAAAGAAAAAAAAACVGKKGRLLH